MSYIKAGDVLPNELVEAIQQYVDGQSVCIPRKAKQEWGSETSARSFFRERNERIYAAWQAGESVRELARSFALSEKSIQRIVREQKQQYSIRRDKI